MPQPPVLSPPIQSALVRQFRGHGIACRDHGLQLAFGGAPPVEAVDWLVAFTTPGGRAQYIYGGHHHRCGLRRFRIDRGWTISERG